jgi:hypothetical protein
MSRALDYTSRFQDASDQEALKLLFARRPQVLKFQKRGKGGGHLYDTYIIVANKGLIRPWSRWRDEFGPYQSRAVQGGVGVGACVIH